MAQPTGLFVPDSDGDGWTPLTQKQIDQSGAETLEQSLKLGDCDDTDNTVYPEAPELCDGKDNDCNGQIDEGLECECTGDADCDDQNLCTDNTCVAGICQFANNVADCDDGSACTEDDICADGVCVPGEASDCEDDNVCTDDSCDPAIGCVNTNNVANCDDGSECTVDDVCVDGACVPGDAPDCDDGSACTMDTCDPALGCVNTPLTCNDGSVCTDDSCDPAIGCVNTDIDCNDDDVCTADTCDPALGCVNTPIVGCCVTDADCEGLEPVGFLLQMGGWWHLAGESFGCITGMCDICTDLDNDGACGGVLPCVPNCAGLECGSDGCGGSCGNCEEGFICEAGLCEAVPAPLPEGAGDCADGLDNDNDGLIDCQESACAGAICGAGKTCQAGICKNAPPPAEETFVTVTVESPANPAEVWLLASGANYNELAPATFDLTQVQACSWGVEITARTPSGNWPYWGCPLNAGTPSKSTLIVKVDGVVAVPTFAKHAWVCDGQGEGNLFLSKTQLGCP